MEITDENIKPIPKNIVQKIRHKDEQCYPHPYGYTRFYAYLTKMQGELVKVTVAVKHHRGEWYCKQVAWHGIRSEKCFLKDIEYCYLTGMGYRVGWYDEGLQPYRKWYECGICYADDKYFDPWAQIVNLAFMKKFPEYKYSGYQHFRGVNLFKFLRLYEKYPQIEYMVKLGLHNYATSITLLKRIGKDKAFAKWLIRNREELNKPYGGYYIETVMEAYKTNRPFQEVQDFLCRKKCFEREKDFAPIRKLFTGRKLKTFFGYIDKQNIKPRLYLDYFNACNYLGLDMSLPKNSVPHDFMHWHNVRIDQYATAKANTDKKTRRQLYRKFAAVAKKYQQLQQCSDGGFLCIIAESPADLIREGTYLQHCVGRMNYEQKVIREESLIFFVRKAESPDIPFVTVEYSLKTHKVLQNYGYENFLPDTPTLNFINKVWLPYANKNLKQIQAAA